MDMAHAYKSMKTSSSRRTIVYKHGMEVEFKRTIKGEIIISKSKNIKMKKKFNKIKGLEIIPYEASFDMNNDIIGKSKNKIYYYTFHKDNDAKKKELEQLFNNNVNQMINLYSSGLRVVDTVDGAIMTKHGHPVFILVKRIDALQHNNNGRADYETLEWLMKHNNNVNVRGTAKSGFSEKYVTVGAHGSHFEKGMHIKKLSGKNKEFHEPYLKKWFGRVKKIAKEYLPFG